MCYTTKVPFGTRNKAVVAYMDLQYVDYFLAASISVEIRLAELLEGHLAGDHGIQGVVLADLYVLACLYLRAALADDDHARTSGLAVSKLHAEVFRVRCV